MTRNEPITGESPVIFEVAGEQVNHSGKPLGAPEVLGDLDALKARIAELEAAAEQGAEGSTDTRSNAQLKAALEARGVAVPAGANKAALQALAAERGA
jgi:hypothetical protein